MKTSNSAPSFAERGVMRWEIKLFHLENYDYEGEFKPFTILVLMLFGYEFK
jgi:hypothetical protein